MRLKRLAMPAIENAAAIGLLMIGGWLVSRVYKRRGAGRRAAIARCMPSWPHAAFAHRVVKIYVGLLLVLSLLPSAPILLRFHDQPPLRWSGVLVASGGNALLLWAMRALGNQYSPCGRVYLPAKIVMHGPYRWLRHPIYVGNWVFLLGTLLATGSLWMLGPLVFYTVALSLQAKREESQLLEAFSEYRQYQQQTRWLA